MKRLLLPVVQVVDRRPWVKRAASRVLSWYYRARGASPLLVRDAMSQAGELPLPATRSTMRWASALAGGASMPRGYRPDRRLRSPEARAEALRFIDESLAAGDDPQIRRQRSYLQRDRGPTDPELVEFVRTALDARLSTFATDSAKKGKRMDPDAGFHVLGELHDLLAGAGLRPFLVSGTLLGVIRNGTLLEHDYDLDMGLLPGDGTVEQVASLVEPLTSHVSVEEHRVWGTHHLGVDYDVFLHYEDRGRYYHATRTHAWWNSPFGLVEHEVRGRRFWVPDDVETYLAENYGDWRTPTAFYHKSFDTPNREYCDTADALLYLYELVLNATGGRRDRYVAESAVRELARNFGIDLRHHFGRSVLLDESADLAHPHQREQASMGSPAATGTVDRS